jgi:tRNA pseudouridine38-40 synthase
VISCTVQVAQRFERIKLTIAYDGRPFSGWQSQPNRNGIQDHISNAFLLILSQPVKLHGAGRTDAGVHALAQVAHADVPYRKYSLQIWTSALNAHLPPEIRILKSMRAGEDFHAQYSALGKVYCYRVWNDPIHHPLEIGRSWHLSQMLDLDLLRSARTLLIGTHDFASFAVNRGSSENTIRTIHNIEVTRRKQLLTLQFAGNGFLHRMVRMLTASLIRVAGGAKSMEWIEQLLREPGRQKANYTAPPDGLYLQKVLY